MVFNARRLPNLVNGCDFNDFHFREYNTNVNTQNYFLSKSPPPISYRNLHLVATNRIPSNIVILSKPLASSLTSINRISPPQQKPEYKKNSKQTGFDVYRSLFRTTSHSSLNFEQDGLNDDASLLASSITVDRISLLPSTTTSCSNKLPKIQKSNTKHKNNNQRLTNKIKTHCESCSLPHSKQTEYMGASTAQTFYRPIPINQYNNEDNDRITTTTTTSKVLSCMPNDRTRKQLHVYMPQISY